LTLFWKPCGLFTGHPLGLLRSESYTYRDSQVMPGFQELCLELSLCCREQLSSNSFTPQCSRLLWCSVRLYCWEMAPAMPRVCHAQRSQLSDTRKNKDVGPSISLKRYSCSPLALPFLLMRLGI